MTGYKIEKAPLTDRQVEVTRLAADGLTNAEIAKALTLSITTVQSHVEAARDKLQARNRVQLVAQAVRRGLID